MKVGDIFLTKKWTCAQCKAAFGGGVAYTVIGISVTFDKYICVTYPMMTRKCMDQIERNNTAEKLYNSGLGAIISICEECYVNTIGHIDLWNNDQALPLIEYLKSKQSRRDESR